MKNIYLIIVLLTGITFTTCLHGNQKNDRNQKRNEINMKENITQDYFFKMNKVDLEKFIKNVRKVNLGTNVNYVVKLLGTPDEDIIGRKKENGNFICRILSYYIQCWKEGIVNQKRDKLVSFYFDKSNILYHIESTNIKEIPSLPCSIFEKYNYIKQ